MKILSNLVMTSSFMFSGPTSAGINLEDCRNLQPTCSMTNAEQRKTCLSMALAKIRECTDRMRNHDEQLHNQLQKAVQSKGKGVVDPLKAEKANHLQKMKELESILKWHDANVKSVAGEYARYMKEFKEYYRSEADVQTELHSLSSEVPKVSQCLHLIDIQFGMRTLFQKEQILGYRFADRGTRLIEELQQVESFIKEQLRTYAAYIAKNAFADAVPDFNKELGTLRNSVSYAQDRVAKLGKWVDGSSRHIDVVMSRMEREQLAKEKALDFKEANLIQQETSFVKQVSQLVDNGLIKVGLSEYQQLEYFGPRYKALQELLALETVCSPDVSQKPRNEWLAFGCSKFAQIKDIAKRRLHEEFPELLRTALVTLQDDKPETGVRERKEMQDNLNARDYEQAANAYDRLLQVLAQKGGEQ